MSKNKANKKQNTVEDKIKTLDLGEGVEFSMTSHKCADDEKGTVTRYFSNRQPKIEARGRELEVEVSSVETENNELLHYLFSGARNK